MVHLVEHQLWLLPEPREPLVPGAAEALRTPGSLLRPSASKEQLLGADVGTLRPHRGCSNTAPLIFPGRQLQPLRSAWLAEAKLLRSDVADLERPFWGSSQTHTHVHTPKQTCPCTHTHTCACTQTCVCTRTRVHTNVCAHGHTCAHKHTCTQRDTCTCAHTHTDAYLGRAERGRPALEGTVAAGCPPRLQTVPPHPGLGGAADAAASIT